MSDGGRKIKFWQLAVTGAAIFGLFSPALTNAATLAELLKKQTDLQKQADQSRQQIEQKKREASNLKEAIGDLDDDISYTQSKINNTESQIQATSDIIGALGADIAAKQGQLDVLNAKLKAAYVNLYEMSQTSTIELLLQGNSLDDLISQTQYVQSIQSDLQHNIVEVNKLKVDLEGQKKTNEDQRASLEALKSDLSKTRSTLSSQKNQKNYLLNKTQGEQAKYEALLKQINAEVSRISSEIYSKRAAGGGYLAQGGSGGYSWPSARDTECASSSDPWGYCFRQCTSFAAERFLQYHGVAFMNTRPGSGSAYNWPALAADQGYKVSSSPTVGAVVSWNRPLFSGDQWGHVAFVEEVFSSTDIVVSEYNWSPALGYSKRRINPNSYGAPRYIRP